MANIAVTVQEIQRATGTQMTYQAPTTTDTYQVPNDGRTFLHVKKTGAGACTVTVVTPATVAGGLGVADATFSVAATTGDRMIGPFDPSVFNDPATGLMNVTFSDVVGLTFAAVRLP